MGSLSGGAGCSGVGRHSEIAEVPQGFGSRGLAVESEPIIGGSVADPDGCFDLKRFFSFSLVFLAKFRSDMTQNIRRERVVAVVRNW